MCVLQVAANKQSSGDKDSAAHVDGSPVKASGRLEELRMKEEVAKQQKEAKVRDTAVSPDAKQPRRGDTFIGVRVQAGRLKLQQTLTNKKNHL